jgi:hypothetical protein
MVWFIPTITFFPHSAAAKGKDGSPHFILCLSSMLTSCTKSLFLMANSLRYRQAAAQ